MDAVDGAHGAEVAEGDLVGADADNGTVGVKERLYGAALLHADDVGGDPEVGDGGIPRSRKGGEGREEETVEHDRSSIGKEEREDEDKRSRCDEGKRKRVGWRPGCVGGRVAQGRKR